MTPNERKEAFSTMTDHVPVKNADDLRAVANGIFLICRDTDDMSDTEIIQSLSLMCGMACGAMMCAAKIMDGQGG